MCVCVTVDETGAGPPDLYSQQADGSHEASMALSGQPAPKDSCTAFVSNLDYSVTADQLRGMFSKVHWFLYLLLLILITLLAHFFGSCLTGGFP